MKKVESFELDHTKIKAPYVRRAGLLKGKKGDAVEKYDLRFVQPNKKEIPPAALHTLEHLLAVYLRNFSKLDIIDISPMGCLTGFYMTLWSKGKTTEAAEREIAALLNNFAANADKLKKSDVKGVSKIECGNYKLHSLPKAKKILKHTAAKGGFYAFTEKK